MTLRARSAALALVLAAASTAFAATPAFSSASPLLGSWDYLEQIGAPGEWYSCVSRGTYLLEQKGTGIEARYRQSGECTVNGETTDASGEGVGRGSLTDATLALSFEHCTVTGALVAVNEIAGRIDCRVRDARGEEQTVTGTWSAHRLLDRVSSEQMFREAKAAYDRRDFATALGPMREAAEFGNGNAQHWLGHMYQAGQGVPADAAAAAGWFRRAAEQGVVSAQRDLGHAYNQGTGVAPDPAAAAAWFRRAAERGDAASQVELGRLYVFGRGVTQDVAEAARWFRRAADYGNASGQLHLGIMYRQGMGVPSDPAEAIRLFRRAAAQGNEDARRQLRELGEP